MWCRALPFCCSPSSSRTRSVLESKRERPRRQKNVHARCDAICPLPFGDSDQSFKGGWLLPGTQCMH
ncbi:hypothetical protein GQ55_4G312100 [Panicum hallii var. hallii]|uniref:Uncharacterized protein n=1 Tax=Panicum hallii var. hallii TaxID=1504633 RepID=A0A2T7E258_9POAL|nr:hypothetical protein GQ55_4G312100 [Panicum hallii var. hallii]